MSHTQTKCYTHFIKRGSRKTTNDWNLKNTRKKFFSANFDLDTLRQ